MITGEDSVEETNADHRRQARRESLSPPLFFRTLRSLRSNASFGRHDHLLYGIPKGSQSGGCIKRERTRIVGTAASRAVAATKPCFSGFTLTHRAPLSHTLINSSLLYSCAWSTRRRMATRSRRRRSIPLLRRLPPPTRTLPPSNSPGTPGTAKPEPYSNR